MRNHKLVHILVLLVYKKLNIRFLSTDSTCAFYNQLSLSF